MRTHVKRTVSRCFAALRQQIHLSVSPATFQSLVVTVVLSRLDYRNAVMIGFPAYLHGTSSSVSTCGGTSYLAHEICRPHHRCACQSSLAARPRVDQVQSRRSDIQSSSRKCATVLGSACCCCRSARSSDIALCWHQSPAGVTCQTLNCQ